MIKLKKFSLEALVLGWLVGPAAIIATTLLLFMLIASQWRYAWHLFNVDEVSFAGWTVPVPKQFYVSNREEGLTLWKTDLGTPLFSESHGLISLFTGKRLLDYENDFEKLVALNITLARADGVLGEVNRKEFPLTPPRYCVEILDGLKETAVSRCIVDGTSLMVWYSGNAAHLPAFYSTVRGITRIPTKQSHTQTAP